MYYQPKKNLLYNRTILVTGANGDIGFEAAITFARYGANIILLGRNKEKLEYAADIIANQCDVNVHFFTLDLLTCTQASCKEIAQHISNHYTHLDGVLHNAGMLGEIKPMEKQNPDIWQQVMQVNVNGTFFLTQALLPLLLKSYSGSLVFTTSSVGHKGRANWGAYSVSKFATEGMMQVLAEEYRDNHQLRVNCINPGRTRTKMRAKAFPTENIQRLKTPSEIMSIYLWLMGDDSRYKTGMTFDAQPTNLK